MDRKKVIKGLELCSIGRECANQACPYFSPKIYMCEIELLKDALVLLKEQEEEIQQLRLALDIAKGTCKGIKSDGGQFADVPTMQSAT